MDLSNPKYLRFGIGWLFSLFALLLFLMLSGRYFILFFVVPAGLTYVATNVVFKTRYRAYVAASILSIVAAVIFATPRRGYLGTGFDVLVAVAFEPIVCGVTALVLKQFSGAPSSNSAP